ncbi:DNA polymerase III subunit gamma/tau [Candidatus Magnetominusculus xianensis]|uniref:DNA polymerase III subunit gamma/tau n=1 Tax=Candidatus Magnetominusculus xianensis TaxID=1748249 RepID=A0ABR5SGU6_9BACT|nr:DNA polymerase III subunit gamma/tau [Candidatus Magnetominusculus xianensis]KWT85922.1 DNA polymerase III subunit gamma/tau [Candidatus Magnetominusculus xianensis]MBF0403595.1 DNA polymerase III subunit gamma/tau [Nitrospirota bacterium]
MSYEVLTKEPYKVLARKWRPRGFDDLAGQDTAVKILKNAILQHRIAHAYIFSGPRGVGKTSAARVFAKALNCVNGPTASPCNACPNCISIGNGSFLDVVEIDGASNNSVNDIRELREKVKYAPSGAKYKIYIIDEAHMLSNAAFNALLKTLEEPPAHVVFIMATTEPKKIITTVLSRCQHLPFKRIPLATIMERLRFISESAGFNITEGAILALAKAADGSMRDSLTLLDQIASFATGAVGADGINEADVSALTGTSNVSAVADAALAITSGNRIKILETISDLYEGGIDLLSFTRDLIEYFRDALVAACKGGSAVTPAASSEEELTVVLSELLKAEGIVKSAESQRAALEMCLIKISFLSSFKTINEIIRELRAGSSSHKPKPAAVTTPAAIRPELPPELPHESIEVSEKPVPQKDPGGVSTPSPPLDKGLWNRAIDIIYDTSVPLWSILKDASVAVEDAAVNIIFSGGNSIHADSVMEKKSIIEGVLHELSGRKFTVTVTTAKTEKIPEKDLRAEALANPVVKDALDLFGGAVVEVKPVVKNKR